MAKGLNSQDRLQLFVDIPSAELGLVEASEILVGDHQQAAVILVEFRPCLVFREAVDIGFGIFVAFDFFLAREGNLRGCRKVLVLTQL